MLSLAVLRVLARELTTRERVPRVPEPDLVMDDPEKVAAYTRAGRENGVKAPVYLFHSAQICEVLRDGDRVLDLGCGPATQLAQVARLNPQIHFTGIDLSEEMLGRARAYISELSLTNVEFQCGNMSDLSAVGNASVDAVFSIMAFHHLPDQEHLKRAFEEIARVLKDDGGIYLVDFGRLRSERSMHYFAYQYADRQPELYTLDYLNSLRAAFLLEDFRLVGQVLGGRAKIRSTFQIPYMVAFKGPARSSFDPAAKLQIEQMRAELPRHHQVDLGNLITFFRFGGMRCEYLA